ncbi:MAG: helix-turn-helix domain-containing protein [Tannerellaceae bacterium]|nr:helix-turn-helix domain-containing protein [Tannerellaceae bacterium]
MRKETIYLNKQVWYDTSMRQTGIILFILLTSIPLITSAPLSPEQYKFSRIDADKGLSNSEAKCIYQDEKGFIWIGTPSGLNRYDGYEIITYKQDLTLPGINSNNDIERIQEATDGKLWIKTRMGYTVYDPAREAFEENPEALIGQYAGVTQVRYMYIDLGKNFWFTTDDDIRMYDIKNEKLSVFTKGEPHGLSYGDIADIKQGKNRYWFLYDDGLLECMDAQTHKVIHAYNTFRERAQIQGGHELKLFLDTSGNVWVYGLSHYTGVASLNSVSGKWTFYSTQAPPANRISNDVVISLAEDGKGNIWIGTDHGGINIVEKNTGKILVIKSDERNSYSLPQNTIKCLYKDRSDIMWLGTYKKGVAYYHESIYKFKSISDQSEIPYSDINCFYETPEGNIWIGTDGGGLLYFDRTNEKYTVYPHNPNHPDSPAGNVIVSLTSDQEGRLWIGYYLDGLDCFDGKTFTHHKYNPLNEESVLTDNNAWKVICDRNGYLWVGTLQGGVVVIDTETGKQVRHFQVDGSIYDILETKAGNILIASQHGLYTYNPSTRELEHFEEEIFEKIQLSRNDLNALFEDSRELLWIGTRNGIFIYNSYTKGIDHFKKENGLSADLVQSILEDSEHNMWIATNWGLTSIKVSTAYNTPGYFFHLLNYDSSEGLQDEQFNLNAAYFTSDEELIFGGSSGFNIFNPNHLNYSNSTPKVVLTDLQIYNNSIKPGESYNNHIILDKSISQTENIQLSYKENYFTISFAALDYFMPNKTKYFYKLEGFNNQWLPADHTNRKATFSNLNPGKYTLYIKAMNSEGVETKEPTILHIRIYPPFWKTTWACIIYALIALVSLCLYRRHSLRKAKMKLEYETEKIRSTQQHEMDEIKLRFFTNISHEFRTPLTLILTPLEELLNKATEPEDRESLSIIERNARQLLLLVNQLLDFRKLDTHCHTLQESLGDIVQFVSEQAHQFTEMMGRKQIDFRFRTDLKHLYIYFDADKLAKIIMNVISNAYKFTPVHGKILFELSQTKDKKIKITISDNGIGIPEDALEKIFERFYQAHSNTKTNHQGSGIGLHLTKEFVQLHGGEIRAENIPGGGARFTILLPYKEEAVRNESPSGMPEGDSRNAAVSPEENSPERNALPKLLLVDDNEDIRIFLSSKLKDHYKILQAEDGVAGLEIALKEIPDMILSDVMMPRMDGIEMSKFIKEDIRTSHIPIILLTAKSGEESKLEGLTAGADDYITKPFNFNILFIKMRNLIEAQKRKQTLFGEQIRIEPSKIAVSSLDKKLINKALEYTEANISNPDFSVEELSRELGMSRVHLYKKLSSLTGKTPIEFIRVIRLKRAAQLLEESQLTVSEIAYEVGFNNPKYFRKYFKEEFGVLPSQYGSRKKQH